MKRKMILLAAVAAIILVVPSVNAGVIVSEGFGGDGSGGLNATGADVFSAAITAAGGSATWGADVAFSDNGAVDGSNKSAYLDLGTYINDTKGTEAGLFDLTMTISETTGVWLSLGFARESASTTYGVPSTVKNFTDTGTTGFGTTVGLGTIIYRDADNELDMFGGPKTNGSVDGPNGNTGALTLTVTLDLTPTGGYNGTTNFGTVTWTDSAGVLVNKSKTYGSDMNWGSILISAASGSSGTVSDLTLSQAVPEPATIALLSLGGLMGFYRRRK